MSDGSTELSNFLEFAGTIAFAISGATLAARRGLDWLGVAVLAIVTAVGGGTIRDVVLGLLPVSWVVEPWPILVALATTGVLILTATKIAGPRISSFTRQLIGSRIVDISDAAGLGVFAVTGTDIALSTGVGPFIAVLIGVISGVGGGVIRDVLVGRLPMVLSAQIYAVAALVGAGLYAVLWDAGFDATLIWWIPILATFLLRMVAIRHDWSLPKFDLPDQPGGADSQPPKS